VNEKVAAYKTDINAEKMISTLEKSLAGAKKSGNDSMVEILTKKIEAGVDVPAVTAKAVTDIDIARAYIDTIVTARPVANFFGGDIMEPVFNWLYYTVDWNVNNFGNIFAKGMYSALMIWGLIAFICYFILSKTQAGNWIYSTGGNLNAAKANGVPTNKVKIALFVNTAFCATMFAACQVFEVNTADTAKGFGTIGGIILGTIIFGIAKEAFFYIPGIDGSFYRVFLGAVLVTAAFTNENIRKRIMGNI
jgi:simple sugar transport system permease protein